MDKANYMERIAEALERIAVALTPPPEPEPIDGEFKIAVLVRGIGKQMFSAKYVQHNGENILAPISNPNYTFEYSGGSWFGEMLDNK